MRQPITYDTVLEQLVDAVPQLAPIYEKEVAAYAPGTPPQTVFIELWFVPYLIQQLTSANELEVKRCFAFLEQLASSGDSSLHDLLGVAVAEPLIADSRALALALPAAGPKIRKLIARIRDWPNP